ncbi:MAG: ribonuclease H-like domain-containing protein [Lachnospiraceae bacterium]|nr:ribonuclease H-like domain-containing protein [Lachnospiraceae bacterium]
MKIIDSIITPPVFNYTFPQDKEEILFFDIETTGLSPKTSSLYMIGAMFFDGRCSSWKLKQFFADNYKSEAEIIKSFLEILGRYKYLYHFNGKTFDIPYILNKCEKHGIKPDSHCISILNDKDGIYSVDILALIRPLKKLLSIQKASQPELERWLGIMRKDQYGGGQLISVYSQYIQYKTIANGKAPELEGLLLLHNHDDIKHMLDVCSILSYRDLFSSASDIAITDITPGSRQGRCINIYFSHNVQIPKETTIIKPFPASGEETIPAGELYMELGKDNAILSVPLFYGNLKYFYPVRKKAAAKDCYIKKEGMFIPSITLIQPENYNMQFYITYHDQICFYALPDETVNIKNPFWCNYVKLQLSSLVKTT